MLCYSFIVDFVLQYEYYTYTMYYFDIYLPLLPKATRRLGIWYISGRVQYYLGATAFI